MRGERGETGGVCGDSQGAEGGGRGGGGCVGVRGEDVVHNNGTHTVSDETYLKR